MPHQNEHEAFSASRSIDYVFVANDSKAFSQLDGHVQDADDGVKKLPLVVVGEPGIGKSALLANWVQYRRGHMHRDEFLFQHFVGASLRSYRLANLLFRLATALKEHFHLRDIEVPETEDRLRWSLVRYLEAASKKAPPSHVILIVIDGINALKSEASSSDGSLHWLPTELPANVRLVLSTTRTATVDEAVSGPRRRAGALEEKGNSDGKNKHDDDDDDGGAVVAHNKSTVVKQKAMAGVEESNCTYTELCRRHCPFLMMRPLEPPAREQIVTKFLHKHQTEQQKQQQQHQHQQQQQHQAGLLLEDHHVKSIVAAQATSCSLFLRTLLYALKVKAELRHQQKEPSLPPINEQLALYLGPQGSVTGILRDLLDCAQAAVDKSNDSSHSMNGLLGHVLAALYASRNGLSDEELHGLVELGMGTKSVAFSLDVIFLLLKDMTLLVNGFRSFSHESFREMVFEKYVGTPEAHVRQHELMARYFQRFPSCPRKLDCLAFHLEAAGLWQKLKEALVNIENFKLWWTPSHKKEFLLLWRSLTNLKATPAATTKPTSATVALAAAHTRLPTASAAVTANPGHQRPYFDMVDEYVRSLEDYQAKHHPNDEDLSKVVLRVADFLLEFAVLGYEELADPPSFLHPLIPSDDLKTLGVPHLIIDEDGTADFFQPILHTNNDNESDNDCKHNSFTTTNNSSSSTNNNKTESLEATLPQKTFEQQSPLSTYFYHRWMWIQFPNVAVANCVDHYAQQLKAEQSQGGAVHRSSAVVVGDSEKAKDHKTTTPAAAAAPGASSSHGKDTNNKNRNRTGAEEKFFVRNKSATAARTVAPQSQQQHQQQNQAEGGGGNNNEEVAGAMERMAEQLHSDIRRYRQENDVLVRQRLLYEKTIQELNDELVDLERIYTGSVNVHKDYEAMQEKERKTTDLCDQLGVSNKCLMGVLLMCERHPPGHTSMIQDLEEKIEQDSQLVGKIRDCIWEETFERQTYTLDYPKLREAIQESVVLQHHLLASRCRLRANLSVAAEANLRILSRGLAPPNGSSSVTSSNGLGQEIPHHRLAASLSNVAGGTTHTRRGGDVVSSEWSRFISVIYTRSAISDPELFFQKAINCDVLGKQLLEMKWTAERKLAGMKAKQSEVESDLYYSSSNTNVSAAGSATGSEGHGGKGGEVVIVEEVERLEKQARKAYVTFKHLQEKAVSAMLIEQRARAGLHHVAELMGIPDKTEIGESLPELGSQMESVLSLLLQAELTLRNRQQLLREGATSATFSLSPVLDALSPPPPQLQRALAFFETSKPKVPAARLLKVAPSRGAEGVALFDTTKTAAPPSSGNSA